MYAQATTLLTLTARTTAISSTVHSNNLKVLFFSFPSGICKELQEFMMAERKPDVFDNNMELSEEEATAVMRGGRVSGRRE